MPFIDGILYEFNKITSKATVKRIAKSNNDLRIVIPADVQGYRVTKIGENAFKDHVRLQEIVLPPTLETIENSAFMNCNGLRKVFLNCISLQLGQGAFWNCRNLEFFDSMVLINVSCLSHSAFAHCSSLKEINNVEFVGPIYASTFERCSSLKELHFGHNTEIKSDSLKGCRNLRTIYLDGNINITSKSIKRQLRAYKLVCTEVTSILDWAYEGYCIEINDDYLPF